MPDPIEQYLVFAVIGGPLASALGISLFSSLMERRSIRGCTILVLSIYSVTAPIVLHFSGYLLSSYLRASDPATGSPFRNEWIVELAWFLVWTIIIAVLPAAFVAGGLVGASVPHRIVRAVVSVIPVFALLTLPAVTLPVRSLLNDIDLAAPGEISSAFSNEFSIIYLDALSSQVRMRSVDINVNGESAVVAELPERSGYLFATEQADGTVALTFWANPRVSQSDLRQQPIVLDVPEAVRASFFTKEGLDNQDVRIRTASVCDGDVPWMFSSDHTPQRTIVIKSSSGDVHQYGYYSSTSVARFSNMLPIEQGRWQSSYLTQLSDSVVLFQMRFDEIWLFDAQLKKLEFIGRGRCPIVVRQRSMQN